MQTALYIAAALALFIGLFNIRSVLKDRRRRRRVLDTPTTPIREARGGTVEVRGRVVAGERGLVTAPFSGLSCVWVHVRVFEYRRRGKYKEWQEVVNEVNNTGDFLVDDGSGELAKVMVPGSTFDLDAQTLTRSGTFNEAPLEFEQFLQSRGASSRGWLGLNKDMRYEETVLCPGDTLYVLGPSRRLQLPAKPEDYRSGPASQLVLEAGPTPEDELLVCNKEEREVVARLNSGWLFLWFSFGLSLLLAAIALLRRGL